MISVPVPTTVKQRDDERGVSFRLYVRIIELLICSELKLSCEIQRKKGLRTKLQCSGIPNMLFQSAQ